MAKATMVSRMTSVVWDMMTMAWGLHPCTLEATVPCHAWDPVLGVWTDEDSGKTHAVFCIFQSDHVGVQHS